MNETTLQDVLKCLESIKANQPINEILLEESVAKKAKQALDKMLELS